MPTTLSATAAPEQVRGRRLVVAAVSAVLWLGASAPAAAQFSAQPVILDMRTDDSTAVATITVRNESVDRLQLRVYASDFDQSESGEHQFMAPGEHPHSCASRLQFYPDNVLLEGGGQAEVRVRMDAGASSCWSLVFVQNVPEPAGGVRISQRIGVKVYGVGTGIVPEGEIRSVSLASDTLGLRWLEIDFLNPADGPLSAEGEVEIRTEQGEIVEVIPVKPFTVLPGRSRVIQVRLEREFGPGHYLAIPIIDFGGDYLAGGQLLFEVGGL